MMGSEPILPVSHEELRRAVRTRAGERRIGEGIVIAGRDRALETLDTSGARFALLGVPEDIGVRANFGRPGAAGGWGAFLEAFLNLPENGLFPTSAVSIAGTVPLDGLDAGSDDPLTLRRVCEELDVRVESAVRALLGRNLIPIVIGGGHNNALPILRAVSKASGQGAGLLNIDPHLDFRALEGRHSGNPFSYAAEEGSLALYSVFGFHESAVVSDRFQAFLSKGWRGVSFEDLVIRRRLDANSEIRRAADEIVTSGAPFCLDIDLDAIANMPSSASSPLGWTLAEACAIVREAARKRGVRSFHLPEGAPALGFDGERIVGRALASLASSFIEGSLSG